MKFTLICSVVLLFAFLSPANTHAQAGADCAEELEQANETYSRGRFDETIALLDRCLAKEEIPEEERLTAYRLKGLSYIGKGLEGDARSSVRRLLALVPNYEPDPVLDPPDFVSLVAEIKQEMVLDQPQTTPPHSRVVRSSDGPERGGFTLLLSLGLGLQDDQGLEENTVGLSGLNLGIGGFLSEQLALMLRVSGTTANYTIELGIDPEPEISQVSGVLALSVQYWVNDKVYLEGGPGLAVFSADVDFGDVFGSEEVNDQAFGLVLGAGFTLSNKRKNNLHLGLEYAPGFFEAGTIHNIGVTIGYQLL